MQTIRPKYPKQAIVRGHGLIVRGTRRNLVDVTVLVRICLASQTVGAVTIFFSVWVVGRVVCPTSRVSREATRSIGKRNRKKTTERMAKPLAALA